MIDQSKTINEVNGIAVLDSIASAAARTVDESTNYPPTIRSSHIGYPRMRDSAARIDHGGHATMTEKGGSYGSHVADVESGAPEDVHRRARTPTALRYSPINAGPQLFGSSSTVRMRNERIAFARRLEL
jgi:hypothetical protein